MTSIRISLLGLGGVGGYFGAKLARTYSAEKDIDVIFLAREKTADTIRKSGIRLITPDEDFLARPGAISTDGSEIGPVDFLLCSMKSYDLESGLKQFSSCIGPQTIILPLLNGIDAVPRIKAMFPDNEIWNGCVYIVSRIVEPGIISEMGNIHTLHFGSKSGHSDQLILLRDVLLKAHHDIFLQENIEEVSWEKFIFISTIASLTSYYDVGIGKILEQDSSRQLLTGMLEEIVKIARAENILLPEDIAMKSIQKMARLPYDTTSSMHSDFQRGSKTEVQSLTGHVITLAKKHNIAVPIYDKVLECLTMRQQVK